MGLKGYVILITFFCNLAVLSALSIPTVDVEVVDVGEIINPEDLTLDDIREPSDIQKSSILPGNQLWISPVPYVLDKGLDLRARGVILRALNQFRIKSCIDFKPRNSEEYYLNIQKLDGCWSYIGRLFLHGQALSMGQNCDTIAVVEHEILHALGFYHEQSRYDRDSHVQIVYSNILQGKEHNFRKVENQDSTTHGSTYDYMSVMHYSKNAFSNGNGATIITIDPKFQDVIGQRLEMSPTDVQELNLLYKCNSAVAFKFYCGFSNKTLCQMSHCSQSSISWEVVTQVTGGPSSDHTSLAAGNGDQGEEFGYFMHASTAKSQEGESARLETKIPHPSRKCNVQCLQFYYYHTGGKADKLNIWIREFQDKQDTRGTLRLMGQITGPPSAHWKLHHVSLNATRSFQVVFEVRKGAGASTGGFSIDDINLSETECPHVALQIDEIEKMLSTSLSGTRIYSPRRYSKDGYAYRITAILSRTRVEMYVQLLSGKYDNQLKWPCLEREMSFQLLDQTPNMQLQMSKQWSFISDLTHLDSSGNLIWGNPRETGNPLFYENDELVYGGALLGYRSFATLEELQSREVVKGGSAIFMFNFEDLTPLNTGHELPCPRLRPVDITNPPSNLDEGPCSQTSSSLNSPPKTEENSIHGFSPAVVPGPLLTLLLAVMLLMP